MTCSLLSGHRVLRFEGYFDGPHYLPDASWELTDGKWKEKLGGGLIERELRFILVILSCLCHDSQQQSLLNLIVALHVITAMAEVDME